MSVTAMAWAWQQDVSPTDKLILLALADHADSQGVCWPGLMGIAKKCHLTQRAVRRHVEHLSVSGFIERQARYREDGSQASNCYVLPILSSPPDATVLPPRTLLSSLEPSLEPKDLPRTSGDAPSYPVEHGQPSLTKRKKPPSDPHVKAVIDHYYQSYLARFKSPPPIAGGKCGNVAKRLLAGRSLDDAKWLITAHLDRAPEMYERKNLYGLEHVLHAAPVLLARRAKDRGDYD